VKADTATYDTDVDAAADGKVCAAAGAPLRKRRAALFSYTAVTWVHWPGVTEPVGVASCQRLVLEVVPGLARAMAQ
jgi:hypothetical protein